MTTSEDAPRRATEGRAEAMVEIAQSAIATGDQCWGTPNFDWYDIRDILTKIEHVE